MKGLFFVIWSLDKTRELMTRAERKANRILQSNTDNERNLKIIRYSDT